MWGQMSGNRQWITQQKTTPSCYPTILNRHIIVVSWLIHFWNPPAIPALFSSPRLPVLLRFEVALCMLQPKVCFPTFSGKPCSAFNTSVEVQNGSLNIEHDFGVFKLVHTGRRSWSHKMLISAHLVTRLKILVLQNVHFKVGGVLVWACEVYCALHCE